MKSVQVPVPIRLHAWVSGELYERDQADYWRIYWFVRAYLDAHRAGRITAVLTVPVLVFTGLATQGAWWILAALAAWMLLLYSTKVHAAACLERAERIKASDPDKWRDIQERAAPICAICTRADATVAVTVTLPDA